jgi:hypothetical protein
VLDGQLNFRDMIDSKAKAAQTKGLIYAHPISGAGKKASSQKNGKCRRD